MTAVAMASARRTARVGVRRERHQVAYPLLVAVMALVAIGVVMVYSASSVHSYITTADPGSQGLQ
ncbi:MAG: FtsW/RodA/SpoVE family cell cycle protein, partial [Chloroflexota bacterium]|nr:FtsW/RodA/SpoVE family cell cycle protein [Chloroflexota bacterium]